MSAPAEFVVTRHLIGHPDDSSGNIAVHCGLDPSVTSRIVKRLRTIGAGTPHQWLEHLRSLRRRPPRMGAGFRLPNPELWFRAYSGPYMASGEAVAASVDHLDVVPSRFIVYVASVDMNKAMRAALDVMGSVVPVPMANLELRIADPWLRVGEQENVVEKGQRQLDYLDSPQIQLLRAIRMGEAPTLAP